MIRIDVRPDGSVFSANRSDAGAMTTRKIYWTCQVLGLGGYSAVGLAAAPAD